MPSSSLAPSRRSRARRFPNRPLPPSPRSHYGGPLVVIVNHGTAGPAELVAAAILDNKRGDLVGDRSFGEGTVQKTIELPDGAAVILSVAKYQGPIRQGDSGPGGHPEHCRDRKHRSASGRDRRPTTPSRKTRSQSTPTTNLIKHSTSSSRRALNARQESD